MGGEKEGGLDKKGQFTIFVILGFVLLIVIAIILYAVSLANSVTFENAAQKAVNDYINSANLNYYVYTCMDTAVKEAVNEWAMQGGTFYKEQGGYSSDTEPGVTHIPFQWKFGSVTNPRLKRFNIAYSIWNESMCPILVQNPPNYPLPKTYFSALKSIYNYPSNGCIYNSVYKDSGFFGLNNISRLCFASSKNADSTYNLGSPCTADVTIIKNSSVEKQLADIISNKTQECINFTVFREAGHNITVLGAPNTSIIFNKESFSFNMEYPFLVKLENQNPVLIRHNFEYKSDLRVTRIHNYVLNLLREETQNPFFNIAVDYSAVPGFDPYNMKVTVVNVPSGATAAYKHDHILVVEDAASKIGNQSLTFFTAIKNRAPALDYIHKTDVNSSYDIIAVENETINISPIGIDPDDKPVTYTYSGWKETWDEIFNFSAPYSCSLATATATSLNTEEKILKCMNKLSNTKPRNWTNSALFKTTHRAANITLNASDIGVHNTTVFVEDESGLRDWQILKILVIDKPFINMIFQSPYGEFPENLTSVEDPFNISAKGTKPSIIGGQNILEYNWTDVLNGNVQFSITTQPPYETLILPFDLPFTILQYASPKNPDINKINTNPIDAKGMHDIILRIKTKNSLVSSGVVNSATMKLNVTECLPHRDSDNEYPYNLSGDGFSANHTCCLSDFTYADASTICFQADKYGSYFDLAKYYDSELSKNTELAGYKQYNLAPTSNTIMPVPDKLKRNDIYQLYFNRSCDGFRGNVCGGPVSVNLIPSVSCPDKGKDEVCSGPPHSVSDSASQSCVNYSEEHTFETEYHLPGATGICNSDKKQSNKGVGGYDTGTGIYSCQGTCDGQGGCSFGTNCECKVTYGAECDANNHPAKIITKPTGDYCQYGGCKADTCTYNYEDKMPCPSGQDHCLDAGYCVYSISCTSNGVHEIKDECQTGETCTSSGCL